MVWHSHWNAKDGIRLILNPWGVQDSGYSSIGWANWWDGQILVKSTILGIMNKSSMLQDVERVEMDLWGEVATRQLTWCLPLYIRRRQRSRWFLGNPNVMIMSRFWIVLCCLMCPEMSSLNFCDHILKLFAFTNIMLSAYTSRDREQALIW